MCTKQYILKEILSQPELELFLRLRYDGFCNSASSLFVTQNNNAIDINYYDRNSLHYGIYMQEGKKEAPVGYFRIVLEQPTAVDTWVTNISAMAGLTHLTEHKPASMFPCLGIYPDRNLEHRFYTKKPSSEKADEVSRFVIVKSERSLKLSLKIISSAFAIGLLHLQHAFVGCFNDHSKVYMKFGFRQCPGSSAILFDAAFRKNEGIILYCKKNYLTTELKKRFKIIQGHFFSDNCIRFEI